MTDRHPLIAFALLLFAICYLATIAALLAYHGKYAEALGFGGITTGLGYPAFRVDMAYSPVPVNSSTKVDRSIP